MTFVQSLREGGGEDQRKLGHNVWDTGNIHQMDRLKPGRVIGICPKDGVSSITGTVPCGDQYDVRVLDALLSELPELR